MTAAPAALPRLVLEHLSVTGKGWFEALLAAFSPMLTSILGSKGTGKTTLLLFVAYVLEVSLGQKELATVKNNLGGGRIELRVTADGTRYILARSWNGRTAVYNERHEPVKLTVEGNPMFAVDFYSHDQIGSIADKPEEQLALLDRLAGKPMKDLAEAHAAAKKELRERTDALLARHAEKTQLENLAAEAGEIGRELESLAPKEGPLKEETERARAARILRGREQRTMEKADAAIDTILEAVRLLERDAREKLAGCIDADLLSGPNGAVLRPLEEKLVAAADGIAAVATEARRKLDDARKTRVEQTEALTLAHAAQEHEHGLLVAKQNEESTTAARRLQLSERFAEVMTAPASAEEKKKEWARENEAHAAAAARTFELRDRRSLLRRETCVALDDRLAGDVRMFLGEGADKEEYVQAIADGIKDHVTYHVKLAKKLAELLPQERLVEIVEAKDVQALAFAAKVKEDEARAILAGLGRLPHLLAIQLAEVDDLAEVQLAEEGEGETVWKGAMAFSHGERITAVLPMVMHESDRPLLIDQPEDDLDNQYIYERVVVRGVLAAKDKRQMVFATHSANIGVNGKSEQMLVVRKAKGRGHVSGADTLEAALRLLEGGKEALLARLRAYGLG